MTILGPANLPSEVPYHASQMFAKNVVTFLQHLVDLGLPNKVDYARTKLPAKRCSAATAKWCSREFANCWECRAAP